MTGEKWQTAWQIYSAAREMTLGARKSFLDSASSDPEIIREVLLLLEQSEGQGPDPTGPDSISTPGSQFLNEKQWYGKFEITGSLGRGGMGQVFSARDTELGRNVALKFLNPGATLHPAATQKLLREAQTASALNHPNIVTIHEVIRSESSIAIVMELVEGQSVRELCKKRLPVEKVISIGQQIARALAAAHALGIVHRDIKPENIIVRPDGGVKVLDFGLARQVSTFSENSNPSLPAGTLRYMSPEQARGEAATSASDVFSLGLVLHELLTGQHAFPEDTPGGGAARPFTAYRRSIAEHAWMPDGQSLLVSCQCRGTVHGIWRFPLNAPTRPERVAQSSMDAVNPATGRQTSKMAWVNRLEDLNVYRIAATGAGKPQRVIASTQRDYNPVYVSDGRIAWISDRSGSREIWIAREDGSGQTQVTHLNGPSIDCLQWSFDGRYLAFESRAQENRAKGRNDIFLLECPPGTLRCGEPSAMNLPPPGAPGWSADSQMVYFISDISGRLQIWKRALSGGTATAVTETPGYQPRESPDGKWLYFFDPENNVISRIPGSKGDPKSAGVVQVVGRPNRPQYNGWAVTGNEVVFIAPADATHPAAIRAYNPSTGKLRSILDLTEVLVAGGDMSLSVSKDGKSILYTQLDRSGSNIIVAERSR